MASPSRRRRVPLGVDPSRIPPNQSLAAPGRWPVLHTGAAPGAHLATWDLRVFGLVERELRLTHGELRALPVKEVVADIHCVTGWSRLGDRWAGVAIHEILRRCR